MSLLDVNVLLALAWPNHQFHAAARRWFRGDTRGEWSTCAITELGFIRLSSNPAFTDEAKSPRDAVALLARMTAQPGHRFLADLPSLVELEWVWSQVGAYSQTTDAYLTCVASHHEMKLVTFDGRLARNPALRRTVELIES